MEIKKDQTDIRVRCCGQIVGEETGRCVNKTAGGCCDLAIRCKGFTLSYFKSMPKKIKKSSTQEK